MSLAVPNYNQYLESVSYFSSVLNNMKEQVDWVVYWSFVSNKIRPWLSDIDIFLLYESDNILFPIEINILISEIKDQISLLWIPLQISGRTSWALRNSLAAPEYSYLQEVMKWIKSWNCSKNFGELFLNLRNGREADLDMARHFLRKINELWDSFAKINRILLKDKNSITTEEQKSLRNLWDNFKKSLSLFTISLRIDSWKSHFSKEDSSVISLTKKTFWKDLYFDNYEKILSDVNDINDWYEFLKHWWLEEIQDIYNRIFTPAINSIAMKLQH